MNWIICALPFTTIVAWTLLASTMTSMVKLLIGYNVTVSVNSYNEACRYGSLDLVKYLSGHATHVI